MSRMNRHIPGPVRLRRCCVGATGALNCYTLQLARGQEYLMRLNDGDNCEKYDSIITYIHTYIHKYIHTYIHTCTIVRTYIHTHTHT